MSNNALPSTIAFDAIDKLEAEIAQQAMPHVPQDQDSRRRTRIKNGITWVETRKQMKRRIHKANKPVGITHAHN